MPVIRPFNGKPIIEHITCTLEPNTMIKPIPGGFVIVPLKEIISHEILFISSFVNCLW